MALDPGDPLLNGHYRIVRLLGRGGFGFVYQAQDTLLGENVAIKELIPALVGDEVMLKRFLAEARATMRLTHNRIVRSHNVFSEGGNYYIVMEYMPGGSLEERMREQGALPVDEAVQVAADVSEGLGCAHEEGVVHCDLKPQNILFDAGGRAKVADFGIAHVSGEMLTRTWHTPAGFVAGTLPYMSPEQTDGVRDDPRIDVYALGAVLYRMLTGRTYLDFDPRETPRSQSDNVQRIFHEQPQPPSTFNGRVAPWLDAVVLKALAKRPEDRFADAGAMRAALLQRQPAPLPLPAAKSAPAQPAQTPAPGVKLVAVAKERTPLPAWFWPAVGGAVVLLVALIIAVGAMLGGGDGMATMEPQPTRTMAAAVTTMPSLTPTRTPTPTSTPPGTDTPVPTLTATNTPWPTSTSRPATVAPTPSESPSPATATRMPTNVPAPTATAPLPLLHPPASTHAGDVWTRTTDGMVMVYVPSGEFPMGANDGDIAAQQAEWPCCHVPTFTDQQPQHVVHLDAFWIDRTEVTNSQYRDCVDHGSCSNPGCWDNPSFNAPDQPVVCVNWNNSKAYCAWAGARLPTEAQWEKAARGTDARSYPWGGRFDCHKGNFDDEKQWDPFVVPGGEDCDGYPATAPVGSFPGGASPYGALDMAGNVAEWVADLYNSDYYATSPLRNPQALSGQRPVVRGGSVYPIPRIERASFRWSWWQSYQWNFLGFRCAVSPGG